MKCKKKTGQTYAGPTLELYGLRYHKSCCFELYFHFKLASEHFAAVSTFISVWILTNLQWNAKKKTGQTYAGPTLELYELRYLKSSCFEVYFHFKLVSEHFAAASTFISVWIPRNLQWNAKKKKKKLGEPTLDPHWNCMGCAIWSQAVSSFTFISNLFLNILQLLQHLLVFEYWEICSEMQKKKKLGKPTLDPHWNCMGCAIISHAVSRFTFISNLFLNILQLLQHLLVFEYWEICSEMQKKKKLGKPTLDPHWNCMGCAIISHAVSRFTFISNLFLNILQLLQHLLVFEYWEICSEMQKKKKLGKPTLDPHWNCMGCAIISHAVSRFTFISNLLLNILQLLQHLLVFEYWQICSEMQRKKLGKPTLDPHWNCMNCAIWSQAVSRFTFISNLFLNILQLFQHLLAFEYREICSEMQRKKLGKPTLDPHWNCMGCAIWSQAVSSFTFISNLFLNILQLLQHLLVFEYWEIWSETQKKLGNPTLDPHWNCMGYAIWSQAVSRFTFISNLLLNILQLFEEFLLFKRWEI